MEICVMNKWSVGWGTIKDCNMKCKFCYSKEVRTEQIDALGLDIWIRFIDNNHKYIEAINYGTGENSISDDWFELISYINERYKIPQAITTNGYLSERITNSSRLQEIFRRSIQEVDVSLDFANAKMHNEFRGQANAYNWAINMLETCKAFEKRCSIVFIGTNDTLTEDNLGGLFEIALKYNMKLRMNLYRPTSSSTEINKQFIPTYSRILNELKFISDNYAILALCDPLFSSILSENYKRIDPSGTRSIRILADGSITPSTYLISEDFRTANILTHSLNELKIAENYAKIPIPAKCHNCCFEEACKGGVLDRRFLWYSSFSERDPYCPFRENNYLPSFKVKQVSNDVKSIHQDYLPTMFFANNEKFSEK